MHYPSIPKLQIDFDLSGKIRCVKPNLEPHWLSLLECTSPTRSSGISYENNTNSSIYMYIHPNVIQIFTT